MDRVSWTEAVPLLAAQTGTVILMGAVDVGKTTLTLEAANAVVRGGRSAAILDTDLGQGEIGPPGTIGVVRLEAPVASIADIRPRALAFVGDTAPYGHLLAVLQGTHRLVTHALSRRDQVVFVDTSGVPGGMHGRMPEKLKLAKVAVLNPSMVVFLEKENELERLAGLVAGWTAAPRLRVQSPPDVRRKSPVYRRIRRAHRMRRHFEQAKLLDLDAGQARVFDAWLYTGTALTARQLQFVSSALKTEVPHGEITADGIYLCAASRPAREGFVLLHEEFGRKRITVTPAAVFQNLLVGLIGPGGHLLDIGLLQGVNFERALLSILTPARSVAEVTQIHFGRLRVRPDGSEIAHLRPSDI